VRYWRSWVKHCDIPPLYQEEVIRSALTLKLHCFEDTGAIVAALTTSIPEAPGSGRTWDYRYCWLRDAYYALGAFRLLGHFEEREQFLQFLLNVVSSSPDLDLAPLYRIDGKSDLDERVLPDWPGYLGEAPFAWATARRGTNNTTSSARWCWRSLRSSWTRDSVSSDAACPRARLSPRGSGGGGGRPA
jgi:GH15 family glucan-1,4-alpha-glucosidase